MIVRYTLFTFNVSIFKACGSNKTIYTKTPKNNQDGSIFRRQHLAHNKDALYFSYFMENSLISVLDYCKNLKNCHQNFPTFFLINYLLQKLERAGHELHEALHLHELHEALNLASEYTASCGFPEWACS